MRQMALFLVTFTLCAAMAWLSGCRGMQVEDHPRLAAGVTMQDRRFWSPALQREMPYRVFLPAPIAAGEKLPVVYLLHGRGPDFRDWSNHSVVAAYAQHGLILVMPEGGSSFYMNAVSRPGDRYEDYLVLDLPAEIESHFPAKPGRASRALVGISMGGFGAVTVGLRHPERYAFVAGLSPALDAPERHFSPTRPGQWWLFRTIFGPMGSPERSARDPFRLVPGSAVATAPYFYLTVGEQEPLLEPTRRFAAQLARRGVAYEFHTSPGGHDWQEWSAQIPGCFARLFEKLATAPRPAPPSAPRPR